LSESPETPCVNTDDRPVRALPDARRLTSSFSLRELGSTLARRHRLLASVMGPLLLLCLLYCLIAPRQYESSAKIALRTTPASSLILGPAEGYTTASALFAPMQQETLANVFRSDQLAWAVICKLKLYETKDFHGRLIDGLPPFRADTPSPEAQAYLLERFRSHLRVQVVPRTLLIQVRFRSGMERCRRL